MEPQEKFMKIAIKEAIKSKQKGDYAIGAVIVKDNKIIAKSGNAVKIKQNPLHHAEAIAIQKAAKKLKHRHLHDCILYTTHEPCPMCASLAIWAKLKGIISGTKTEDMADYRKNNENQDWSWRTIDISAKEILQKGEPKPHLIEEFMREECRKLFHS
ncbi:MAG: nucleoside deaminase [Nanoarchaeota archaeon]